MSATTTTDRCSSADGMVPLTALGPGGSGVIAYVDPDLDHSVQHRLRLLGFCEGREISYVRRAFWSGPIVFRVCDVHMCIRAEQAAMIRVAAAS